jgi:hypothetical protein
MEKWLNKNYFCSKILQWHIWNFLWETKVILQRCQNCCYLPVLPGRQKEAINPSYIPVVKSRETVPLLGRAPYLICLIGFLFHHLQELRKVYRPVTVQINLKKIVSVTLFSEKVHCTLLTLPYTIPTDYVCSKEPNCLPRLICILPPK